MYSMYIWLFLFLFSHTYCFNLDTNNPIVYVDPGKKTGSSFSSYFGYTIVLFPGSQKRPEKWIKIGAPRGQDPKRNFTNPGVVYDCPFMKECKPVDIFADYDNHKSLLTNAWVGGTMDISYKFERLSICGFKRAIDKGNDYHTVGACYLSYFPEVFEEVMPLRDNAIYKQVVYLNGQGQAGFSMHFPTNENHLVLGAPGVYNWAGTVIDVEDVEYNDPVANRIVGLRSKRGIQRNIFVANAIQSRVNVAYDLFGYSVTSGYFYGNKKLYYVGSTPKSSSYRGKVVVFQFDEQQRVVKEKESKIGSQFGEYFGASLAAGDINNDNCDDLIVGAPYHVVNTYNEGSVYVFLGKKEGQLKSNVKLYGQSTKGQFGSAVMFLGDINKDGYGDIAIGAPHEEEFSGVLYIYKGNSGGLDMKYSQRIIGKNISPEIRGFGISISRPADIDENGFKDIAVGAYLSGNAVLLRSKPIIVINYKMRSIPKELKRESKNFLLEICYEYTHFNEDTIDINRTVVVDEALGRATIGNEGHEIKIVTISKKRNVCENITISVKNTTNYIAPITTFLTYQLANQTGKKEVMYISDKIVTGNDMFCVRCPLLDDFRSSRPSSIDVPFTLDCGDDNICQASLSIDVKIPNLGNTNTFVVGSSDYVHLEVTVKNTGEKAYSTQLEITLPNSIFFRQIPSSCNEHNISVIICNVDNPLRENKEKLTSLDLDMKNVNKYNYYDKLDIILRVRTTSNNDNTDWTSFTINLERLADITIYGKSEEQSIPLGNATYGSPNFTQMYQVEKVGVSPLEKVLVNITVPYGIRTANGEITFMKLFPPNGIFAGQPVICRSNFSYILDVKTAEITEELTYDKMELKRRRRQVKVFKEDSEISQELKIDDKEYEIIPNRMLFINCSMENIICSSIFCFLGPFEKRQTPATIQMKMMIDSQAIYGLLGTKNIILYSTHGSVTIESPSGFNQNGNRPDSADVSTIFVNETVDEVALWIIILSAIAGLLLLVLIVYGLTKVGFFKRAKKEELKNLKAAQAEQENVNDMEYSTEDQIESPTVNSSNEGLVEDTEEK